MHDKLKEIINQSNLKGEIILSAPYQLESIKSSIAHLDLALGRLKEGELELFAYHIKDTLESIGQITSPYTNEEMLDKMFSEFCLGKWDFGYKSHKNKRTYFCLWWFFVLQVFFVSFFLQAFLFAMIFAWKNRKILRLKRVCHIYVLQESKVLQMILKIYIRLWNLRYL